MSVAVACRVARFVPRRAQYNRCRLEEFLGAGAPRRNPSTAPRIAHASSGDAAILFGGLLYLSTSAACRTNRHVCGMHGNRTDSDFARSDREGSIGSVWAREERVSTAIRARGPAFSRLQQHLCDCDSRGGIAPPELKDDF